MTRALGLDAGKHTGFAVCSVRPTGRATFTSAGVLDERRRITHLLELLEAHHDIGIVAVEIPRGHLIPGRPADALLDCARIGGELVGTCRARGLEVVEVTANEVRKALCGNSHATDAMVKSAVRLRVAGWPTRSSTHARDAAAAGIFAAVSLVTPLSRLHVEARARRLRAST